jgi:hypothetical protein
MCINIARSLNPELVLCALLWHGADITGASATLQDPIHRTHHVLSLIDLVLPVEPDAWSGDPVHHTLLHVLLELATFFRALDVNGRAHLIWWLAVVDGGVVCMCHRLLGQLACTPWTGVSSRIGIMISS